MAQDIGASGSLAEIATFGLNLGASLQTFLEGTTGRAKGKELLITSVHVNATASNLLQIQDMLDKDHGATLPIFREAGRREIDRLAAQCKRIYLVVILVLNKAAESRTMEKGKLEMPAEGFKNAPLNITKLRVRRGFDLEWLKPREKMFERELLRVKFDLSLLQLLGNIAQCQLRHPTRAPGSFEEEQALRALADIVAKRRVKWADGIARNHSKALEAATKASSAASSVDDDAKSTITTSTSTAVDSHPPAPPAENEAEIEAIPPLTAPVKDAWQAFVNNKRAQDEKNGTLERFLSEPSPDLPQPKTLADSDSKQEAPEDKPSDKTEEETKCDKDAKVDISRSKPSSTKSQQKTSHMMPSWIRQIFSNESHVDWENEDLEVVLLELTVSFNDKSKKKLTKLEMDDEGVKSAVAKLTFRSRFKRRPRLLEQYKLLDPRVRQKVDEAITTVKQWSSRGKEWVAIEVIEEVAQRGPSQSLDVSVMLFFRLGEDVEPVHLDVGREILLPFEHCRTWESTQSIISKLLWEETARQRILNSRYDICLPDDAIIPHETWASMVHPGMKAKLKLWPILPLHARMGGMGPPPHMGRVPNFVNVGPPPRFFSPPSTFSTVSTVSVPEKPKAEKMAEIMKEMDELMGIEMDLVKETDVPRMGLGELLVKWTNAPDTHVEEDSGSDCSMYWSVSDTRYSSSGSSTSSGSDSD
ncbi:hypothetical protein ACHAPT_006094 [Fusarium lateritium]